MSKSKCSFSVNNIKSFKQKEMRSLLTLFFANIVADQTNAIFQSQPSTVSVCPGEGDRYGDFKCNHDKTHRVCAQLLDS